jgi:predicted permease
MRRIANKTWGALASELAGDVRYALRSFGRTPGLTAVIVVTLALGIGATTAIFSVVNAVLLRPMPYADPERIVQIVENIPADESPSGTAIHRTGMNVEEFDWWRTNSQTLSHIAVIQSESRTLATTDGTVQLSGARVSPSLFPLRGVPPLLGRGLLPDEERPDADVIVLSEFMWREHFGGDSNVVGRTLVLDGRVHSIVGVMPLEFGGQALFWMPFVAAPEPGRVMFLSATARLRDGVSIEAASAEANVLGMQLRGMSPEPGAAPRFEIVRELDQLTVRVSPTLRVLVVAVAAVLLIVCTNVANLLLVRGTRRQQEIAIRRSLGATRGRIARQVLTESAALAAFAGLLGIALAFGGVQVLKSAAVVYVPRLSAGAAILPRMDQISIDPTALAFVGGLALVTGALFGVLPALRLSRFGERGHNAATQLSAVAGNTRVGHVLATVQLAFAMALLIGAGLLLHSFLKLAAVDPGFDARGVLSFELVMPGDSTAERKLQTTEDLVARLRNHPQVSDAGFTDLPPLMAGMVIFTHAFVPEGTTEAELREEEATQTMQQRTQTRSVSAGYLRALGARLVDGRWFEERQSAADRTVLVSRPYAQRYFAGRTAVGATLRDGHGDWTIVGVVDDFHIGGLDGEAERTVFIEPRQRLAAQRAVQPRPMPEIDRMFMTVGGSSIAFAARTTGDPLAIVADLRSIVRDIDPALAIDATLPMEQVLSGTTARPRFYAALLSVFGAIAGFIAVIGIYGVLAYVVEQRTKEIGIRMALGAEQSAVLRLVLRRGAVMVTIGVTSGLCGALGLTRYLEGMLFGITALDATTYASVAAAFAAVALFACYLPARRATTVDPLVALRHE